MKLMLKSDAEKQGMLYGRNCIGGFQVGSVIVTELISKFGNKPVDLSIFEGLPQCRIQEINLYAGWYRVTGSSDILPLEYLGTAERAYLLSYLAYMTRTSLVCVDILDEFSMATAKDYFMRFLNCEYITLVFTDDIVYMRCMELVLGLVEVGDAAGFCRG